VGDGAFGGGALGGDLLVEVTLGRRQLAPLGLADRGEQTRAAPGMGLPVSTRRPRQEATT
jgi:hypothetical protein